MLTCDSSTARLGDEALTTAQGGLGAELIRHRDEMVFPELWGCLWILSCALELLRVPSLRDQRGLERAHRSELMSQVHTVGRAG